MLFDDFSQDLSADVLIGEFVYEEGSPTEVESSFDAILGFFAHVIGTLFSSLELTATFFSSETVCCFEASLVGSR